MQQQAGNADEFRIADQAIQLYSDPAVFSPTDFGRNMGLLLQDKLQADQTVCELGLGSGVLAVLAGLNGANVVGLDKNPNAVALTSKNWELNGLPEDSADFRPSDLFSGIKEEELGTFDMVWSNPPLLPDIGAETMDPNKRESYEVAGPSGRLVLDAMLTDAKDLLAPGGKMYTIATSLQGWEQSKSLLDDNWDSWQIAKEVDLELTYECGPAYIAWWQERQKETGETYLFEQDGKLIHKLWFVEATKSA